MKVESEMLKENIIFGVAGPIGSGKGVIVDWFKDKGFVTISLSDEVRIELTKRGIPITRATLQEVGNELRETLGDAVLAERAWEKINQSQNKKIVIESIRHPQEAKFLKKQGNFYLLSITSDQQVRFKRYLKRKNTEDTSSWDQFLQEDTEEAKGHHGEHGQLVEETAKLADYTVDNSGTLTQTYNQLEPILKEIKNA